MYTYILYKYMFIYIYIYIHICIYFMYIYRFMKDQIIENLVKSKKSKHWNINLQQNIRYFFIIIKETIGLSFN